jgi:hypothetical protein
MALCGSLSPAGYLVPRPLREGRGRQSRFYEAVAVMVVAWVGMMAEF